MKNNYPARLRKNKESYGVLTEISKDLNSFFGDESGRTISRRTAQGFKKGLDLHHVDDESAEFIVHAGMVASGALLKSNDETSKGVGVFLAAALWGFYQNGK